MATHGNEAIERMCQKLDENHARLDELSHRMGLVEASLSLDKDNSLSTTGCSSARSSPSTKDLLPLSIKKDLFDVLYKEELDEFLLSKTWSALDPSIKKKMLQSAMDQIKIKGCETVLSKDINNSLRQFYTQRRSSKLSSLDKELRTKKRISAKVNRLNFEKREHAIKEAISQGKLNGDDQDSLIQFKETISPIKRNVITVYDSDDENSIFNMKENKRKSLKIAREVKAEKKETKRSTPVLLNFNPVCTSTQNNFVGDSVREPQPWDYGAGYMDRTIDYMGRPYFPGYGPFAEDFGNEPQIYNDRDRTFVDSEDY